MWSYDSVCLKKKLSVCGLDLFISFYYSVVECIQQFAEMGNKIAYVKHTHLTWVRCKYYSLHSC